MPVSLVTLLSVAAVAVALLYGGFVELHVKVHPKRMRAAFHKHVVQRVGGGGGGAQQQAQHQMAGGSPLPDGAPSKQDAPELLKQHSKLFEKREVLKVAEGVHMAIGFGLANCVLITDDSPDGVVIIDAMESEEAMLDVMAAFKHIIAGRRVDTLVYTHFHQDHTGGGRVVGARRIVAFHGTLTSLTRALVTGPITYRRGMRQFGVFVPPESFVNSGIGPNLRTGDGATMRPMLPTETFEGATHNITAGSLQLTLVHCPGETPDQIVISYPKIRLLVASDNIYESLPNLYAIRGTPSRDAITWARSLDMMRALRPAYLVPLHTRPVVGEAAIFELLTAYRDAIQFLHDQTVFHMNRGLTPDEIVARVRLPSHLASHPWLQPFYGTAHWAVRAIFSHHLGWFSGDVRDLEPSAPGRLSRAIAAVASPGALLAAAEAAMSAAESAAAAAPREEAQLALELASIVLDTVKESHVAGESAAAAATATTTTTTAADTERAATIRRRAIAKLASLSVPATGRNYYTTYSLELDGELDLKVPQAVITTNLKQMATGEMLLRAMSVNLDAEASEAVDWLCQFTFTDTSEDLILWVRRGVADIFPSSKREQLVSPATRGADLAITTTKIALRCVSHFSISIWILKLSRKFLWGL